MLSGVLAAVNRIRDALPGLFALGEELTAEQLVDWLPDR
jgi:hypothetical protein